MFRSNLEKLRIIYDWYKTQDTYDVFYKWNHLWNREDKEKQALVDKKALKAADLTKKLIFSGNADVFNLLEDELQSTPMFSLSWTRRFGRYVSKGFIGREYDFYALLEKIYAQHPNCCFNLAACIIDRRSGEKNLADDFRNKCFNFVDKIIEDYTGKDDVLVGTAHGVRFIWHSDEDLQKDSYDYLFGLVQSNQKTHPEEAIRWLRMLLFYSHKHNKDDFEALISSFEQSLNRLSAQQVCDHMHPNILSPFFEIILDSKKAEQSVLDAMLRAESVEDMRVIQGYTDGALQKSKSEDFKNACLERLDAMLTRELLKDTDEAARTLSRIGQWSKGKGREDEFPKTMELVSPFLEKIYSRNPTSIDKAKVIYGSHGSEPFQHPKYVEIYQEFIRSKD